ncbi:hypothetical protein RISK_005258 [Rhodopirellula islandica]|uniref:Uncharacterized protein n=1 Tax=Rhodopirellula islandica TaxID=595434 RepID=A0A0J1B625_RHOIS|nr:hypothetical protein RISK_005258 [Rhodopirellula islandica]
MYRGLRLATRELAIMTESNLTYLGDRHLSRDTIAVGQSNIASEWEITVIGCDLELLRS